MGYPYNFEPLNFVRAAMSLICSSFAAFQILSYRKTFQVSEALVSIPASATDSGETDSGETDSGEQAEEEDEETGPAMMYWIYSCFGIVVIYTSMMVVRWYVAALPTSACMVAFPPKADTVAPFGWRTGACSPATQEGPRRVSSRRTGRGSRQLQRLAAPLHTLRRLAAATQCTVIDTRSKRPYWCDDLRKQCLAEVARPLSSHHHQPCQRGAEKKMRVHHVSTLAS